ncbi:uncharacterized protein LOC135683787 [Rhopilema esculentum]|uniref:uncharacterized protein LOC135683787 n=1 Tax=Rhopilema esculentum TaxID=499914 RepID=UPI0031D0F454
MFLPCLILSVWFFIYGADTADIFVSPNGKDTRTCGSLYQPCHSLIHAVEKRARSEDVIKIDGQFKVLALPRSIRPINTAFSRIHITSYNGPLTIISKRKRVYHFFSFPKVFKRNSTYSIKISNLNFHNIHIMDVRSYQTDVFEMQWTVDSCRFTFDANVMKTSYITIGKNLKAFQFTMIRCYVDGASMAELFLVRVSVRNTTFIQITLDNSTFVNVANVIYATELNVNKAVTITQLNFSVRKCVFYSHKNVTYKKSLFVIFGSLYARKRPLKVLVEFLDSKFFGRSVDPSTYYAAVLSVAGFVHFKAKRSLFRKNSSGCGGALNLKTRQWRLIEHCVFEENTAIANSICGDTELSGNGGAILVNGKFRYCYTKIVHTVFRNNIASCYGDSVYAVHIYEIILEDSAIIFDLNGNLFAGTDDLLQRTLWYTESTRFSTTRTNVTVISTSKESRIGLFLSAIRITAFHEINFQCPRGYNAKVEKEKSGKMKKRSLDCVRCADKTYTVAPSYANITKMHGKRNRVHINHCQKCPFGANCDDKLKAKPNFWGFIFRKSLQMISCPPGYCCRTTPECKTIDSCNGKRTGVLCGECVHGYTLSFLSNRCLPKNSCSILASWGVVIALAFIFLMALAFMQEMVTLILRIFAAHVSLFGSFKVFKTQQSIVGSSHLHVTKEGCGEADDLGTGVVSEGLSCNSDSYIKEPEAEQTCYGETKTENSGAVTKEDSGIKSELKQSNSTSAGIIKIVFFYYQMNALLVLYKTQSKSSAFGIVRNILNAFLNFDLSYSVIDRVSCLLPEIGIVRKTILRSAFPVTILCMAVLLYAVLNVIAWALKRRHFIPDICSMKARLLTTILQVTLLSYSNFTSNTLLLLTCVSLANGKKVLYIGGHFECYQPWQYLLLSFFIIWSVPLVFALYLAIKRLETNTFSVRGFYTALLFPLPYIVFTGAKVSLMALRSRFHDNKPANRDEDIRYTAITDISNEPESGLKGLNPYVVKLMIKRVLGGAYRYNGFSRLAWEPMLILQRLILLSLHAFIQDPVSKSLSLLLAIFILSCLNIATKPFHSNCLNAFNYLCMFFLFTNGVLNSFNAYIYTSGTEADGPFAAILSVLDIIEICMQLLIPCAVLVAVLILTLTRIMCFAICLVRVAWMKLSIVK